MNNEYFVLDSTDGGRIFNDGIISYKDMFPHKEPTFTEKLNAEMRMHNLLKIVKRRIAEVFTANKVKPSCEYIAGKSLVYSFSGNDVCPIDIVYKVIVDSSDINLKHKITVSNRIDSSSVYHYLSTVVLKQLGNHKSHYSSLTNSSDAKFTAIDLSFVWKYINVSNLDDLYISAIRVVQHGMRELITDEAHSPSELSELKACVKFDPHTISLDPINAFSMAKNEYVVHFPKCSELLDDFYDIVHQYADTFIR